MSDHERFVAVVTNGVFCIYDKESKLVAPWGSDEYERDARNTALELLRSGGRDPGYYHWEEDHLGVED